MVQKWAVNVYAYKEQILIGLEAEIVIADTCTKYGCIYCSRWILKQFIYNSVKICHC